MADIVESEAERLGSLTSRLLRTARLDSEEVRPRMELIDIASLVSDIASSYRAQSSDRRIVLTNAREEVEVLADPELLRYRIMEARFSGMSNITSSSGSIEERMQSALHRARGWVCTSPEKSLSRMEAPWIWRSRRERKTARPFA
jgi:hypothetical protein